MSWTASPHTLLPTTRRSLQTSSVLVLSLCVGVEALVDQEVWEGELLYLANIFSSIRFLIWVLIASPFKDKS